MAQALEVSSAHLSGILSETLSPRAGHSDAAPQPVGGINRVRVPRH
jgi:hypothetical protein